MRVFQNLRTRMLGGIFLVLFVMIAAVSGILLKSLSEQREKQAEKYLIEKAENISIQLDEILSRLDSVSSQLLASRTLQGMFVAASAQEYQGKNYFEYHIEDRKTAQDVLWTFNSPKRQIESINIFSDSSYVGLRYSPQTLRIQEISGQRLWQVPEGEKYTVIAPHKDEWETLEDKEVISLVRPFIATTYRFQNVGIIEVQEKYSALEQACQLSEEEEMSVLVLDGKEVIYGNRAFSRKEIESYAGSDDEAESSKPIQRESKDGSRMEIKVKLKNTDWTVIIMQQKSVFLKPVKQAVLGVVLVSLVISVLVFLILFVTIHNMTKPILQLAEDMDKMKTVDQMPVLRESSVREIRILQNKYRQLMERMKESKDELVLAGETELQLRILGMQEQVNPHFLFNSLTAISAVSMEEGGQKVPVMCYQLSELFRYTSGHNSQVTLKAEMEYLETYLAFMKWRYEDNFVYEIEKDGNLENVMISKMVFQPLAENCFTHGFKYSMPPYRMKIHCVCNKEGWMFEVSDNGGGFSEDTLRNIQAQIRKIDEILDNRKEYKQLKTQDMAILNIYIRLRLKYRRNFHIEIEKDERLGGTRVRMEAESYDKGNCN